MSSFFGTDDSGAQMCKMCDLANRKISMHKLHMSQAAKDRSIADKVNPIYIQYGGIAYKNGVHVEELF